MIPLVVPLYRYVASTSLLYLPLLRKHRGCGAFFPFWNELLSRCSNVPTFGRSVFP